MSPAALLICTSALHRIAQRLPGYSPDLSPPELDRELNAVITRYLRMKGQQ